jgi:hypothetical protein
MLSPLLAPGRLIVVPVVFCRFAQESASGMAAPSHRCLANMVRPSKTMSRCHTGRKSGAGPKLRALCSLAAYLHRLSTSEQKRITSRS